jgi:hypothetical protein
MSDVNDNATKYQKIMSGEITSVVTRADVLNADRINED